MIVFLRVISGLAGLLCFYLAIFLYETEEGKIQNRLEDWWLRAEYLRVGAHTGLAAFLQRVALLTTAGLDRLFGLKLFSIRAVWPSTFLSVSAAYMLAFLGSLSERALPWHYLGLSLLGFIVGVTPALAGTRACTRRACPWVMASGALAWVVLLVFTVILPPAEEATTGYVTAFLIAWAPSVITYMLIVGVLRWTIRRCADFRSAARIVLSTAALVFVLPFVVLAPTILAVGVLILLALRGIEPVTPQQQTLIHVVTYGMDLGALLPVVLFVLLMFLMPIHELLWALIGRSLYAVQREKILANKKLLAALGVVAITFAIPQSAALVRSVAGFFGVKPG